VENPKPAKPVPRTQGVSSANLAQSGHGQPVTSRIDQSPVVLPTSAKPTSARSPRGTIQCYLVSLVVFIFYSRFFDVYLAQYKIPAIAVGITALASLFSGHLLQSLQYRVSKLLILFTVVLIVSSAFSVWRGGSVELVTNVWFKSLLVYVVIVSLIRDWRHSAQLARTMAWSIGVLSVLSYIYANGESGRFFLKQGKLENPNDLAQALLVGLPFLLMLFSQSATLAPTRIVSLFLIGALGIDLLHTGSRGAMVSAAICLPVVIATSSSKVKIGTALVLVAILASGTLAFSPALRARYLTFFDSTVDEDTSQQTARVSEIAVASAMSRREVLLESVKVTLLNPILGVGPDMFAEAREREAAKQGKHAPFLITHNTYTQVSSECGIPALVIFIAILVSTFRTATRIHRLSSQRPEPSMKTIAATASALRYSVLAYATTSIFLSVAYQALLPTLAGMVVALEYSVARQLAAPASRPVKVQPPATAAGLVTVPAMPVIGYATRLKSKFREKSLA
jgi:putative inorganic carbon (hco3(-)) transporter